MSEPMIDRATFRKIKKMSREEIRGSMKKEPKKLW